MSDQDQARRPASGDGHGALRVSHEDRDRVAEALRVAAGDGRLSADELDERLERALTARTYDDLAVLVADLPPAGHALAVIEMLTGQLYLVTVIGLLIGNYASSRRGT